MEAGDSACRTKQGQSESRNPGKIVAEILLSGGGARLKNIDKYLAAKINKLIVKHDKILTL